MGRFKEYGEHDAVGLAQLVKAGDVSPEELLEEALARLAEANPAINAVIRVLESEVRQRIRDGVAEGPLCGVPFVLKDLNTCMKGVPTTNGCALFKDYTPLHDSELVRRYREAGLVIFGKTATPEFGLTTTTESRLFGMTRNPLNPEYMAGGSSGGSAAAVAAGIVPASDGSDGGGSIRIPASCCGLVGLKVSRGLLPVGPEAGERWSGMGVGGVVSRTVRDTAALIDATAGPTAGDPYRGPSFPRPLLQEIGRDAGKLRIALQTTAFNGAETHADCVAAAKAAAELCAKEGHDVEEAEFEVDAKVYGRAVRTITAANTRVAVDERVDELKRPLRDADLEPITRATYNSADRYSSADYARALRTIHGLARELARFFAKYEVLLTPTMAAPPMKVGGPLCLTHENSKEYSAALALTVGYTQLFNATGTPAISLPLHKNGAGLPIGVQFAAPFGGEGLLIRLASRFEEHFAK